MGRGGHNKKTLEQHLKDGTFRADRHGHLIESDEAALNLMKAETLKTFNAITKTLNGLDMIEGVEAFKKLIDARTASMKAYHAVAKMPVEDKKTEAKDDKDGFRD